MTQSVVRLTNGEVLSLADLPTDAHMRWVASRKLTVVRAVVYGLVPLEEALEKYNLSEDEFFSWVDSAANHGENALKSTHIKKYRQL